jgi:hypothetical protein
VPPGHNDTSTSGPTTKTVVPIVGGLVGTAIVAVLVGFFFGVVGDLSLTTGNWML